MIRLGCYFFVLSCFNFVFSEGIPKLCVTPNDEIGVCTSIFKCPPLQKLLGTSTPEAIEFVSKSICCDWAFKDLQVCCEKSRKFAESQNVTKIENQILITTKDISSESVNITITQRQRDIALEKLLPSGTYCGLQHTDDRFYNESETALDEFPWLVHVIFNNEEKDGEDIDEFADRCNGVLISARYVLTNGFCARNPIKVRLGQYNTNKTISCVENAAIPECTEPKIEVKIEELIDMTDNVDSLSLFRLSEKVTFTDFVRPICLPYHDPRKSITHQQLLFSGWGAADQRGVVKKRLTYSLTNVNECYKENSELKDVSVNVSLICLAPQEGAVNSACAGDEGSPLMYSYNFQWFAEAILTKVYTEPEIDCSNKKPINGIRITPKVMEWILDNIRP